MRFKNFFTIFSILVLTLAVYSCRPNPPRAPILLRPVFPELNGEIVQKGGDKTNARLVIVEFFKTWRSPCQKSTKHLNKLDKRRDVKIISVSDEERKNIEEFIKNAKIRYEVWRVSEELFREMKIKYVPHAFICRASNREIL